MKRFESGDRLTDIVNNYCLELITAQTIEHQNINAEQN